MKPVFAKILEGLDNEIFKTKVIDQPYFSTAFHFHAECQITYMVESEGKRIIGDSIENFEKGELIFLGSNIPHVWYNREAYFDDKVNQKHARSISVFFNPDKLIELLVQLGDMQKMKAVLQVAGRGMKFYGETKSQLKKLLVQLVKEEEDFPKMILLFKILEVLTQTKEYDLLASQGYTNTYQLKDNDRMDKVFKYVFENFATDMQLDDVAALINMNKQAFCRYFKSRTQKTFVEFVNEVRIGHACKLITDGERQIGNLAYECGFNSLSNFNRFFKEAKGVTPRDYKKMVVTA
jgi:AraC-like DNA-binding protein